MLARGRTEKWADNCIHYLTSGLDLKKKNCPVAHRSFLNFLNERYGVDVSKWLPRLKSRQSGVDLKVPSPEDVVETLLKVKDSRYFSVYLMLLASGLRLKEVVKILAEYDPARLKVRDGVALYELWWLRGTKRSYHAFWPSWMRFKRVAVSDENVSSFAGKAGLVRPKYMRKFVATRMIELDISPDIVDFIQGRTPMRHVILFTNYAALLNKATREYRKYAQWLKNFLEQNNILVCQQERKEI